MLASKIASNKRCYTDDSFIYVQFKALISKNYFLLFGILFQTFRLKT